MNKYLKSFLLIVLTLILIVVSAPVFGWFHNRFIERVSGSWIGTDDVWMFVVGLFYGYVFFVSLMLTIFVKTRFKYLLTCFFVGIELFVFWGIASMFFSNLIIALIAVALGELILFSYNKLRKKPTR
ncbi:MAG: hypothetical protein BWY53_00253 [Parcubacteria group bacterium ADurb.Bin326]|nr:MAG: hypothetical protein BWY53_00253 [Parcubacteria group bacterium ADurb.Bin326]